MNLIVPKPTDGTGVAAKIVANTTKVILSLSGTNTFQLTNTLKDATGQAKTVTSTFLYTSRVPATCSVSAGGIITGLKKGTSIVEISYPTFDNNIGVHASGAHIGKISWDIEVLVVK